jgi:hypothetical protein
MKNNLFILAFFLLINTLTTDNLFACSCNGGLSFCQATIGIENDLIVSGWILISSIRQDVD